MFRQSTLGVMLFSLITVNAGMAALALARYPAFFEQHSALVYVLELAGILFLYAVATVFLVRVSGRVWDTILSNASVFGVITGVLEVVNIGLEDTAAGAARSPILSIGLYGDPLLTVGCCGSPNRMLGQLDPRWCRYFGAKCGDLHAPCGGRRLSHRTAGYPSGYCGSIDVGGVQTKRLDGPACVRVGEHSRLGVHSPFHRADRRCRVRRRWVCSSPLRETEGGIKGLTDKEATMCDEFLMVRAMINRVPAPSHLSFRFVTTN